MKFDISGIFENQYCLFPKYRLFLLKHPVYIETFLLPTDAHNVKKHRVIKTF